jgi:protein TonB
MPGFPHNDSVNDNLYRFVYELSNNCKKLNLIYYIAASIISHLLLIGFLYIIPPFTDAAPSVFKVDIVAPPESRKPPGPAPVEPSIKKTKPPVIKQRPKPAGRDLPPETLYGKGEGVFKQDAGKSSDNSNVSGKTDIPAPRKGGDTSLPEEKSHAKGEKGPDIDPRSFLFDKNTIEKFAREGSPAQKGLTFDNSEFRHRGYMRMLRARIESIWQYPKEAARMGLSGDLYMRFTIKKDGQLGEVELIRTSGFKELDEAAIKAVKKAGPFWPLPDDWDKDDLEIKGHFIYIYGDTIVF